MSKISVIIPVYNVEKYLEKCLDSVINQTFQDLEIICINDGSTDNSLKILEKYKSIDARIKIISQENKGLAAARNVGFNIAKSDFVYFLDSDDWIHETLIAKAYESITKNNSDIVLFDVTNVYNNSFIDVHRAGLFIKKYHLENFKFSTQPEIAYHTPTAWSKLYRKSFLIKHNLLFPEELRFGEDSPFWVLLLSCNPQISILNECLYYYRKRDTGLSGTIDSQLIEKQWNVYRNIVQSERYKSIKVPFQLTILDFECRLSIYGYSAMNNLNLVFPYEKSLINFTKAYKSFNNYNLWKLPGYRLLKFRHFYTIGKKIVLLILKMRNKGVQDNGK